MVALGLLKALPVRSRTREQLHPRGLGREGRLTLPWVTTLTDPFQMMYHEVPLSPWLNTERSTDQTCPQGPTTSSLWPPPMSRCLVPSFPSRLTYTRSLPCCVVQRAELPLIPASPVGGERRVNEVSSGEEGPCEEVRSKAPSAQGTEM